MSETVISVEGLAKAYRLGNIGGMSTYRTVADRLRRGSPSRVTASGTTHNEPRTRDGLFWALEKINFDVAHAEAVAIIGANGAGKSTLLKILSKVTSPTAGRVKLKGKAASLLEVGTGFHPDLTGRENVFLNGAILGMTRRELADKFDEIVDFSGVEEFIDTPVKRYSSGMYVRLAFAVAAHLQPDILILDEVLAVGDAAFQRKCLGKMNEAAREGRTVLFVSHNMVAVQSLCSRGILLEGGRVAADGSASEVVQLYLSKGLSDGRNQLNWNALTGPGNDTVRLVSFSVGPADPSNDIVSMTAPVRVSLEYERTLPGKTFHLEIHLLTDQDITLLYSSPGLAPSDVGRYTSVCMIPGNLLNSGGYRLKAMLVEDESRATWLDEATLIFTVEDLKERRIGWMTKRPGLLYIPLEWQTVHNGGDQPERVLISNYESF